MADADLDALIRQLAKQQHKTLTAAIKKRRDRTLALADKAKDTESRKRQRQLAKDIFEIGSAAIKRLQMSADNAAYSYGRSVRQAAEEAREAAKKSAEKSAKPAAGATKTSSKKAAKKNATKTGK